MSSKLWSLLTDNVHKDYTNRNWHSVFQNALFYHCNNGEKWECDDSMNHWKTSKYKINHDKWMIQGVNAGC